MLKAFKNKSAKRFQLYKRNKNDELTLFQHTIILSLIENGCSQYQVAWTMGVSVSTISKIVKKFREKGQVDDLPRSDRYKLLSPVEEKKICEMIVPEQCETAVDVHAKFCQETNKQISVEIIRNVLQNNGYTVKVKRRHSGLTNKHKKERDVFNDANIILTKPFGGGSIIVWGCITSEGCKIELVEETLNSAGYIQILEDCLLDVLDSCDCADKMIFQHDNARVHTSIATKTWLEDNNISVLEWPA
ncbi:15537_t:CDS:2 [Racocetra fulgida]|uniref:15537_t:CDS:1 n=1 Tax=Racocetra fulgida TaxID=60492 RepID=A0A9N9BZ33_9GLOM|nr:15537_t:CDS:2 [Racocetra fulgida]